MFDMKMRWLGYWASDHYCGYNVFELTGKWLGMILI